MQVEHSHECQSHITTLWPRNYFRTTSSPKALEACHPSRLLGREADGDRPPSARTSQSGGNRGRDKTVTDNVCDIPSGLLAIYGIDVVPLDVRLGTEAEELSGTTPEEFWCRVRATDALAESSAPFSRCFRAAFPRGREDGI